MTRPFRPSDLAARWGCSDWTIRAMIEDGRLPAFRVGRMKSKPQNGLKARVEWMTQSG